MPLAPVYFLQGRCFKNALQDVRCCKSEVKYSHYAKQKQEATARMLVQLLPLDAKRSFSRCFLSTKESEENTAIMFVVVLPLELCGTSVTGSTSGCFAPTVTSFAVPEGYVHILTHSSCIVENKEELMVLQTNWDHTHSMQKQQYQ